MIDFLKYRHITFVFSLFIIIGSAGLYIYKSRILGKTFRYSVDFTGGTQVLMAFEKEMSSRELKSILDQHGWEGAVTREFSGKNDILVRVQEFTNDATGLGDRMLLAIQETVPDNKVTILETQAVGPGIGKALRWKSMQAVLFALLAMLLYMAIRFWAIGYAAGAVAALFHDAFVMLAFFLLFNMEISVSVIAAILMVLGYSINDTIVIFSRIRDNIKKMKQASLYEIVNTSLNQTFRRTLLTSLSTSLTVLAMFVFGGEILRGLSLALLVGIIFGTYSSIYIASPVMMLLHRQK